MATSSTVVTVKKQMVAEYDAVLSIPVTYAWAGKNTAAEAVFLGPHPETADIRLDQTSQIPTVKADRKQRQETYTVRVTIWTFRPELTFTAADTCETRAFELLASIEGVHAADPRIGLAATVLHHTQITSVASTLFPFDAGWACELAVDVEVSARLT
jgi:hypothetical protein